jgi:release factor glutamine methyltransferase
MTIKQTIKKYSQQLRDITHIPQKEVQTLILHILDKNVIWLHLNDHIEFEYEKQLEKMVQKRATHYPLEYIIGKASFYGEVFLTKPNVLIPRPETEILVEKAKPILEEIANAKVIEIGTGSGIISVMLALLIDDISIVAVDINDDALDLAKQNAIKHKVDHKIKFIKSDLFENVEGDFDMCISNPPYISNSYKLPQNVKYEPSNALFGGNIGDELLKNIIDEVKNRGIKYLLCEMGYDQKEPLGKYINRYNPKKLEFYKDYEKFDRGFEVCFF